MDETIDKAVAGVLKLVGGYGYIDQWTLLTEIIQRLGDEADKAMKAEYTSINDEDYE